MFGAFGIMPDLPVQGAIDFINERHVKGWFRLAREVSFEVALALGDQNVPVKLEQIVDDTLRWKFHAMCPEPLVAKDFVTGKAALRLTFDRTHYDLPLWEPLRTSASVENLNERTLPRFLRALSPMQRAALRSQIDVLDGPTPTKDLSRRPKRALFGNAEFSVIAGSELVLIEMVEFLRAAGWLCDITAWSIGKPMRDIARQVGATLIESPIDIKAFRYDLVWLNNRLESVFDYTQSPDDAPRTLFVFAHLDRSWSFAQPGIVLEPLLGTTYLVTEWAAIERLSGYGLPERDIRLFRNPAPQAFELTPASVSRGLRRMLAVSNHPPKEVAETVVLLRERGIEVICWGSEGDVRQTRLLPTDLVDADAVLTIGKTVPYALRANRPAFVYDHFGGPGWLKKDNFASAADRNFSGLCCERRLTATELCEEIVAGFDDARQFAISIGRDLPVQYRLEETASQLLALQVTAPTPAEHRARLERHMPAWRSERQLALTAGFYFQRAMNAHRKGRG
jgi:hypothetical protein